MQSGAPLFVPASSGRQATAERAGKREMEKDRWREREKKRAKLEYDSINPAIERVEWQARRAGRDDRANVPLDESKRGGNDERGRRGRAKGKASSTDDGDEIPRVAKWVD